MGRTDSRFRLMVDFVFFSFQKFCYHVCDWCLCVCVSTLPNRKKGLVFFLLVEKIEKKFDNDGLNKWCYTIHTYEHESKLFSFFSTLIQRLFCSTIIIIIIIVITTMMMMIGGRKQPCISVYVCLLFLLLLLLLLYTQDNKLMFTVFFFQSWNTHTIDKSKGWLLFVSQCWWWRSSSCSCRHRHHRHNNNSQDVYFHPLNSITITIIIIIKLFFISFIQTVASK